MATEQVKKGWLTTRDGSKYAPKTFTQNIIDAESNKNLNQVIESTNNNISELSVEVSNIKQKTDNIGLNGTDDKLFIVDKDDNIIAYFDATGIHSVNYYVGTSTELKDSLAGVLESTKNFDGLDSDKLFIIDKDDNVVAYIDSEGVHATEFLLEDSNGVSNKFSTTLSTISEILVDLVSVKEELSHIELSGSKGKTLISASEEDNKLFIIDKDDNVIAHIDDKGVHSINFINDNDGISLNQIQSDLNTAKGLINNNTTSISEMLPTIAEQGNRLDLNEKELSYINFPTEENENNISLLSGSLGDDRLFIIDKNDNIIAYIDATGVHSIEFYNKDNLSLNELKTNINSVNDFAKRIENNLSETNINVARLQNKSMSAVDAVTATNKTQIGTITTGTITGQQEGNSETVTLYTPTPSITDIYSSDNKVQIGSFNYNNESYPLYAPDDSQKLSSIDDQISEINQQISGNQSNISNLKDRMETAENELSYINFPNDNPSNNISLISGSPDDTKLFIIDKDENVVAFIDATGVHSLDFYAIDEEGNPVQMTEALSAVNTRVDLTNNNLSETNVIVTSNTDNINKLKTAAISVTPVDFGTNPTTDLATIKVGTNNNSQSFIVKSPETSYTSTIGTTDTILGTLNYNGISTNIYGSSLTEINTDLSSVITKVNNMAVSASADTNINGLTKKIQIGSVSVTDGQKKTITTNFNIPSVEVTTNSELESVETTNIGSIWVGDTEYPLASRSYDGTLSEYGSSITDLQSKAITVTNSVTDSKKTKIGSITPGTAEGTTAVDLYMPTVTASQTQAAGDEVGKVSVGDTTTTFYSHSYAGDISEINTQLTPAISKLNDVYERTLNVFAWDDGTLYIVDGTDKQNVLGYFNDKGLTITNVTIAGSNNQANLYNQGIFYKEESTTTLNI